MSIGRIVRLRRTLKKWRLWQVSQHLRITAAYVGAIERGETLPPYELAVAFARLYGDDPLDYLYHCAFERGDIQLAEVLDEVRKRGNGSQNTTPIT